MDRTAASHLEFLHFKATQAYCFRSLKEDKAVEIQDVSIDTFSDYWCRTNLMVDAASLLEFLHKVDSACSLNRLSGTRNLRFTTQLKGHRQ
jgi:hypothetical protein